MRNGLDWLSSYSSAACAELVARVTTKNSPIMNDRCIFMNILLGEFSRPSLGAAVLFVKFPSLIPIPLACKRQRHSLRKNIAFGDKSMDIRRSDQEVTKQWALQAQR